LRWHQNAHQRGFQVSDDFANAAIVASRVEA